MMRRAFPILLILLSLPIAFGTTGCAVETKLPVRMPRKASLPEELGSYDLKMLLIVTRDQNQSPRGMQVTATTGNSRLTKQIGGSGAVSLTLPYTQKDEVTFVFQLGNQKWYQTTTGIPAGATSIKVYFQLGEAGQVHFSRLEY